MLCPVFVGARKASESSTKFLCSYNAVLVQKQRGYFILFYSAIIRDVRTTVASMLSDIATEEVSAACLVPSSFLPNVVPRKISGMDHCIVDGSFDGVEVQADGKVVPATFSAMEIIGDGGEGDGKGGLGMGHRFAAAVFSKQVK